MPRIHGVREVRVLNVYDAIRFSNASYWLTIRGTTHLQIFGNEHIGAPAFCNLQVPGQLACDQTGRIHQIYARTNLPESDAFRQWSHAATVTLVVGDRPHRQEVLFDCIRRAPKAHLTPAEAALVGRVGRVGDKLLPVDEHPDGRVLPHYGDALGAEHERTIAKVATAMYVADLNFDKKLAGAPFDSLAKEIRDRWCMRAIAAMGELDGVRVPPVIVPVRQNVYVVVESESESLAKLLEDIPPGIAPEPLVWIHLEGFSTRDVG